MRFCLPFLLSLLPVVLAAAVEPAEDLVRIHVEAMGGRERIAALSALRVSGQVIAGGRRLRFLMVAARPNRVRLETENGGRTLVQAWDGKEPPWEFDTGTWPPRYHDMAAANVKTFTADAEFDDPMIAGAERGYSFESTGESEVDGRKLLRVVVKRKETPPFFLLLDPQTYLIILRVEPRQTVGGNATQVITRFDDYRPVKGVLYPHSVAVIIDGKITQQTRVERIDPNPTISSDTFTRPKQAGEPKP